MGASFLQKPNKIMEVSLFEYEISSGFDLTYREQEAIAKLEKITGNRLFSFAFRHGKQEIRARQFL